MKAEHRLREWLYGASRVVVIGVGNPLKRDDFVGVEVVRRLRRKVERFEELKGLVELVEAGVVPENLIGLVVRMMPSHIIIVDAALHDGPVGSIILVEPSSIRGETPSSTHAPSLKLFCSIVEEATRAKSTIVGVRPLDTGFGEGLTEELDRAAEELADMLARALQVSLVKNYMRGTGLVGEADGYGRGNQGRGRGGIRCRARGIAPEGE